MNHDRQTDMLITNFYNEPNTLFINQGNGLFSDRTSSHGLREPSLKMLGFGTQFIDLDNDGTNELFVASNHIGKLTYRGYARDARTLAQFFRRAFSIDHR
ncbi:MAG: VCBS repeat-containing protein [Pirellulales bacterium]